MEKQVLNWMVDFFFFLSTYCTLKKQIENVKDRTELRLKIFLIRGLEGDAWDK